MDYAAADLQGAIGYMFQRALAQRVPPPRRRSPRGDRRDPGAGRPAPIRRSPIRSSRSARTWTRRPRARRADELGWIVKEDAGRGWRRVVPSPLPKSIVEIEEIDHLVKAGYVVIACGGGGIPVCQDTDGDLEGVEAVIDKDLASSMLARELDADLLLISTGVEKVAIGFGRPDQRWLERISRAEAEAYLAAGEFAEGSMAPKIRAIIAYLDRPGRPGLITDPPNIGRALAGRTGTTIVYGWKSARAGRAGAGPRRARRGRLALPAGRRPWRSPFAEGNGQPGPAPGRARPAHRLRHRHPAGRPRGRASARGAARGPDLLAPADRLQPPDACAAVHPRDQRDDRDPGNRASRRARGRLASMPCSAPITTRSRRCSNSASAHASRPC